MQIEWRLLLIVGTALNCLDVSWYIVPFGEPQSVISIQLGPAVVLPHLVCGWGEFPFGMPYMLAWRARVMPSSTVSPNRM